MRSLKILVDPQAWSPADVRMRELCGTSAFVAQPANDNVEGWSFDVQIVGRWGLYSVMPVSRRGRTWSTRHLSGGERVTIGQAIVCDGGDRCRAIVAGMVKDGLRVEVNGVDMKGFGAT
jgi:hypothetical protein